MQEFSSHGAHVNLGSESASENYSQLLFLDFSAVVTLWTIYKIDSAVSEDVTTGELFKD